MMVSPTRVFQKSDAGLLSEVAPADADAAMKGRSVSIMVLEIKVIWSPAEEAERGAEEAAQAAEAQAQLDAAARAQTAASEQAAATAAAKESAAAKLRAFGLDEAEIAAILAR